MYGISTNKLLEIIAPRGKLVRASEHPLLFFLSFSHCNEAAGKLQLLIYL